MSSEFIDILLFGVIAVFLIYRLRSILGSTDGKIVNIKTKRAKSSFKPKIVPENTNSEFLDGANKAYEMIVQAYQGNNIEKVKDLLKNRSNRNKVRQLVVNGSDVARIIRNSGSNTRQFNCPDFFTNKKQLSKEVFKKNILNNRAS